MSKQTHFLCVQAWVDSDFTVKTSVAKSLNEATLSFVGQVLLEVHSSSPAGVLGLKSGDILYALNGGVFDLDDLRKTFQPRRFRRSHSFDFLRPSTHEKIRITGPTFPFGARFGETANSFSTQLRNGDPDPHDIDQFWASGQTEALAELWPAFEAYSLRLRDLNGSPFDGPFPQATAANTPLANEDSLWPGNYTWLALCAAHAGHMDRAAVVLKRVEAHFDQTEDSGMMTMFSAMAYTRSILAEHKNHMDSAIDHMHHAIEMSPETDVLYTRLSKLTGSVVSAPPSPYLGVKPVYELPQRDPTKRFTQPAQQVSLRESLTDLAAGEFILICVMSSYRTNGPYVEGFTRALVPLSRLRNYFREVHIITAWDAEKSRDLKLPIMEDKLRKSGVEVSVLHDVDDALSEQLSLISAPTNLVIDHRGLVVAEGWLGDDSILWDALETHEKTQG